MIFKILWCLIRHPGRLLKAITHKHEWSRSGDEFVCLTCRHREYDYGYHGRYL